MIILHFLPGILPEGTFMKSILKSFKFLSLLAALVTGITTQAMEQEKTTPSDTVTERICLSFNPILEATFKETPKNFYEAIVRLKCIAQLLEKSQIELRENFNLMQRGCRINSTDLPFHMIHPIFKHWLDDACNNILLSHEKSVEAIEIIIETLSKKVSYENLKQYNKAVNSLPTIIPEYIKHTFIDLIHVQENGVYSRLWVKPTFKQALRKRAQKNEESQSMITKIWNYCLGK